MQNSTLFDWKTDYFPRQTGACAYNLDNFNDLIFNIMFFIVSLPRRNFLTIRVILSLKTVLDRYKFRPDFDVILEVELPKKADL
jgi:hypothetical protein